MIRIVVAVIITCIALALFYYAKGVFGMTLGVRTYFPAFVALFFYSIYVLSLDRKNSGDKIK